MGMISAAVLTASNKHRVNVATLQSLQVKSEDGCSTLENQTAVDCAYCHHEGTCRKCEAAVILDRCVKGCDGENKTLSACCGGTEIKKLSVLDECIETKGAEGHDN